MKVAKFWHMADPAEFAELGTAEARTMIEQFRREGVAV